MTSLFNLSTVNSVCSSSEPLVSRLMSLSVGEANSAKTHQPRMAESVVVTFQHDHSDSQEGEDTNRVCVHWSNDQQQW